MAGCAEIIPRSLREFKQLRSSDNHEVGRRFRSATDGALSASCRCRRCPAGKARFEHGYPSLARRAGCGGASLRAPCAGVRRTARWAGASTPRRSATGQACPEPRRQPPIRLWPRSERARNALRVQEDAATGPPGTDRAGRPHPAVSQPPRRRYRTPASHTSRCQTDSSAPWPSPAHAIAGAPPLEITASPIPDDVFGRCQSVTKIIGLPAVAAS